jgi:hypothetical protein
VILVVAAALGAAATRRLLSQMARSALAGGLALAGYVPWPARKQIAQQDLLKLRSADEERSASEGRKLLGRLLERTKAEYDRRAAAGQPPPVIDILIHLGWGRLGGLRGGIPQGVAEGADRAPAGQARVRCCDRSQHRHIDRAIRVLR